MGKKRALLVGINYPGTSHALRGCVNDVIAVRDMLYNAYKITDVKTLTDHQANTSDILKGLNWLVADAQPGDILFFHYSGHGSQYPDSKYDHDEEPDGLDEIICPMDLNWRDKMIRDDDLKSIFDKVPAGVNLTVVLDCCNSGSGLDQLHQYQPLGLAAREVSVDPVKGGRYLPPPHDIVMLTETKHLDFNKPRSVTHRDVDHTGLLISGCQSHQTSADAFIGGKFMGACTYMMINTLKDADYILDYKTLVEKMNNKMVEYGFTQRPELNGSASLFTHKYLAPLGGEETQEEPQEDDRPDPPKRPRPTCRRCDKSRKRCSCPRRWKRRYWRTNRWRRDYARALAAWRIALRKWKEKYS